MKRINIFIVFLLLLIISTNILAKEVSVSLQNIEILDKPIKINNDILAVANYKITAVVLGKKRYKNTYANRYTVKYSDYDLALGWDEMLLPENYEKIDITQGGRWYGWKINKKLNLTTNQISQMTSNHHIVPENIKIKKQIEKIKVGDYIEAKGYLINIQNKEGFKWISSTTNKDTGNGACEIFYITEIKIN